MSKPKVKSKPINDGLAICPYCGYTMDALTPEQEKRFGVLMCCEREMLVIDKDKYYAIVKALDKIKATIEKELLKGMM